MNSKLISIGETAKMLGLSIKTLQRWDKSGKFPSIRRPGGHRYYSLESVENYLANQEIADLDLFAAANFWASKSDPSEPDPLFFCQTSPIFLAKLIKLQNKLVEIPELENIFSLVIAIAGEIGDNSFAHNIGSWPDVPGIFFGYDLGKREIVLADRGRGILETLRRVRPSLENSADALKVAFTEIISGRAPEERGNGLKFVRRVVTGNDISLYFKTGNAEVKIKKGDTDLKVAKSGSCIQGCIALINF